MKRAELMSLDIRYRTRNPIDLYHNLGYVNLDNESCELAGAWQQPRTYHTSLIRTLKFYDAKSAGYDVFFTENSATEQRPIQIPENSTQEERDELPLLHDSGPRRPSRRGSYQVANRLLDNL